MKSRRRIAFPKAPDYADEVLLQQGFSTGEMGFNVICAKWKIIGPNV
jgi:hypothetical protein